MTELERKVQTLQTEATTLSAQLTLFQVPFHLSFVSWIQVSYYFGMAFSKENKMIFLFFDHFTKDECIP
jgi:hypothetical protein